MPTSQEALSSGSVPTPTQESVSSSTGLIGNNGANTFGWMAFGNQFTCLQATFGYNNPCSDTTSDFRQTPTASQESITSGTA